MRTALSWAVFAAAVASFSRLWQGVRAALDGARLYGSLEALGWMVLFLGSMVYLALLIYAADRAAGRVRRPVALFDRILDRGRPEGSRRV
ncbi:MAG: hypothetical protein QN174_09710 [Armatimonadota bacterium]|nr:hypothetical protein [Armatimonadota bacterium]MDR7422788.1 hypothetical protein [Armatimonadota bacterium]MDR7453352.1 hypothetical protein [Armatimonadota bacterium]MDR7457038.1 hypothetical protein [Armatimonadota bacterium]MDR7497220.1 hypothetical protein [Armatimonadota bacterium]